MKHTLLILLIIYAFSCRANDTLTRAQIYNFNVGDTFDYEENLIQINYGPNWINTDLDEVFYRRCIINSIYYSRDSTIKYIIRNWAYPLPSYFDTLIIDSLQYPLTMLPDTGCQLVQFVTDTATAYNHMPGNEIVSTCGGPGNSDYFKYIYCKDLGVAYSYAYYVPFEGDDTYDSTRLIYYSKGSAQWGTPYYIANNSALIHYTPIPEECATWLTSVNNNPCDLNVKITTGNRIPYNGHVYVEMIMSEQSNQYGNYYFSDSLVGYFRNDTLNRRAYVYLSWQSVLDTFPEVTYDFSIPAGGNVLSLSQVDVGGQPRTIWNVSSIYLYLQPIQTFSYIEGVGGVAGLFPEYCNSYNPQIGNTQVPLNLTCFSVCGQTLYPYDSTASCSLAGVNNIALTATGVKVYPTINSGQFIAEILNPSLQNAQMFITDITGRTVKQCTLNNQLNTINIEQYSNSMYIWLVTDLKGNIVAEGKVVKQ